MIQAYFDDSGSGGRDGMVCISGFTAHGDRCERLAYDWLDLLQKHRLTHLHTSDFLSGNGEYKALGLSKDRRIEITCEFLSCLRKYAELWVGVAVESSGVRKLRMHPSRFTPLMFCFSRVIKLTVRGLQSWGDAAPPFAMAFDDSQKALACHGALQRLKCTKLEVKDSVAAYSFADDRHIQCLQAADMLACLTTKEYGKGLEHAWVAGPFRETFLADNTLLKATSEAWADTDFTPEVLAALRPD